MPSKSSEIHKLRIADLLNAAGGRGGLQQQLEAQQSPGSPALLKIDARSGDSPPVHFDLLTNLGGDRSLRVQRHRARDAAARRRAEPLAVAGVRPAR